MPDKTALITGASGYIGSKFVEALADIGYKAIGTDVDNGNGRTTEYQLNLTDHALVIKLLDEINPGVILHTAGLKSLNYCEANPEQAFKVNTEASINLFKSALKKNPETLIIFLSSDYVFDGLSGFYTDVDDVKPATVYGKTKVEVERSLRGMTNKHLIIRTSNVFGLGNGGFWDYVTEGLADRLPIDAYEDTYFTPTYLPYLLDAVKKAIEQGTTGTIHVCGKERVSRYEFAVQISSFTLQENLVKKTTQPQQGLISRDSSLAPSNAVLDNGLFQPTLNQAISFEFGLMVPPYMFYSDQRGQIQGVSNAKSWREVNLINSGSGQTRGGHYHKRTNELLVLCSGKILVQLESLSDKRVFQFIAGKGDTIVIKPWFKHTIKCLEDVTWINLLDKPMGKVKKDIYV